MTISENHVSVVGKSSTTAKVQLKLDILTTWTQTGIPWRTARSGDLLCDDRGHRSMEYFPPDVKALAAWRGQENTPGLGALLGSKEERRFVRVDSLAHVGRSTLCEAWHSDLLKQCNLVLDAVKLKARAQALLENKGDIIEALKVDKFRLERLVKTQECELSQLRLNLALQAREIADKQRTIDDNLKESRRKQADLSEEISSLKKTLVTVVPLHEAAHQP